MPKAIIIGGGIGGLAAAIAIQQAGHTAVVCEQTSELTEAGAGISIWPNGLKALDLLNVSDMLLPSIPINEVLLRSANGDVLSHFTANDIAGLNGDLIRVFHRAELLESLKCSLPSSIIRLKKRCTSFQVKHDGVIACFDDGTTEEGDYLIGADGIHSCIRKQLFGAKPPRFAGYTAWRAVIPYSGELKAGESWGRGARFGIFPLVDNRVYWFAVQVSAAGKHAPEGEKSFLMHHFKDWHDPVATLIDQTDEAAILRNDIIDRKPIPTWGRGRITLLGDAAHPMTPNLGQGACQALEDAVSLGKALSTEKNLILALRKYEMTRMKRANRFVRLSFQAGRMAQARLAPAVWLRDIATRWVPKDFRIRQFSQMFDWKP